MCIKLLVKKCQGCNVKGFIATQCNEILILMFDIERLRLVFSKGY